MESRSQRPSGPLLSAPSVRLVLTAERALRLSCPPGTLRTIKVPPLRVRRADIIPEAQYAMRQRLHAASRDAAEAAGALRIPAFTAEARRLLEAYSFPGNLEELRSFTLKALQHATEAGASASQGRVPKARVCVWGWGLVWGRTEALRRECSVLRRGKLRGT